jgi:hypothetical protein
LATFREFLLNRLPTRSEALPVFSLAVTFIYSWTLFRMFYEVPSWIFYLSILNILVLVAYSLAFALFESLLLFAFTCLVSLCLPARIFKSKFAAQGSLLVSLVCLAAVSTQRRLGWLAALKSWQIVAYPIIFVFLLFAMAILASWIFERFPRLARLVKGLVDRFTVFTYLYVPVSLMSLAVVILRNLR